MNNKTSLVVVPYSKATATSLTLPAQLDEKRWEAIGEFLSRVEGGVQWWIGDWWRFGEQRYGERKAWAEENGMNLQTCMNAAHVAGAVEASRRREVLSWSHHAEVAALDAKEQERWLGRAETERWTRDQLRKAIGNAPLLSSNSSEWYTPAEIVEAVTDVIGQIDLDPCAEEQRSIPAAQHFTAADDGLSREWLGTVYLNPPYGDTIGQWVTKLVDEYAAGRLREAIALLPARVDTQWWELIAQFPACFISGRLKFSESTNSATFPSAVIYLGPKLAKFEDVFGALGHLYHPGGERCHSSAGRLTTLSA